MSKIEHELTDEAVCPHCGYKHADSWEFDDYDEYKCEECRKEFIIEREVDIAYSTKKKED